jgi:hypothetical protein
MNLSRYIAVTERSGGHGSLSWADVDSYVLVGGACSVDDLAGELARDEHTAPDQVRSRILGCNADRAASLSKIAPGSLVKVNYEKGASSETVLDEIPMAGGKYLKFLKWAIGAAQAAERAARESAEKRWKEIVSLKRANMIEKHRAMLQSLGAPIEENSFEKFMNKITPEFLKRKGVSSSLLAVVPSPEGTIVFQFARTSVFTDDPIDRYA